VYTSDKYEDDWLMLEWTANRCSLVATCCHSSGAERVWTMNPPSSPSRDEPINPFRMASRFCWREKKVPSEATTLCGPRWASSSSRLSVAAQSAASSGAICDRSIGAKRAWCAEVLIARSVRMMIT